MIPQERGLEGISIYFIFYLPINLEQECGTFFNANYMKILAWLHELLGEVHVVLDFQLKI